MATPTTDSTFPRIHSKVGPAKMGSGFIWMVSFELPGPAPRDGWIVQEVAKFLNRQSSTGNLSKTWHYWEAWPVARGQTLSPLRLTVEQQLRASGFTAAQVATLSNFPYLNSSANDAFLDLSAAQGSSGEVTMLAAARFYAITLPADFVINNPRTQAGALRSTSQKPAFWEGPGRYRYLNYKWKFNANPPVADLVTKNREKWQVFGGVPK